MTRLTVPLFVLTVLSCSTHRTEPPINHNDNLRVAGHSSDGTLTLGLEVSRGWWNAGDSAGPGASVLAFGEADSSASIPGPLIRVGAGTRIRLDLSNRSLDSVTVLGLTVASGGEVDAVPLAPGERRTVEFIARVPGNYFYWVPPQAVPSKRGRRRKASSTAA